MDSEQTSLLAQARWRNQILQVLSLQKAVVLIIWILFIGGYILYSWQSGLSAIGAILQVADWLRSTYGPLLFLLLFVLRSLLFFSAGVLSVAGGVLYGSGADGNLWVAFIYVMAGTWLSALLSFGLARYFGATLREHQFVQERQWHSYLEKMRRNGFMAVLLMRLLLLPFDPINYLAGFAKVQWRAFAWATFLGIIPTAFAFASFGAAIDLQALAVGQMPRLDWRMFVLAVAILAITLLISRLYQRRVVTE